MRSSRSKMVSLLAKSMVLWSAVSSEAQGIVVVRERTTLHAQRPQCKESVFMNLGFWRAVGVTVYIF